jgi:predicted transcriptional regulator
LSTFIKFKKTERINRRSLDIVRDMLVAASVSVRKTRIMYQTNLNYAQVKKYLHNLIERGLLKHDGESCYLTTEKGLEFLELYDNYAERCMLIKKQMSQSNKDRLLLEKLCSSCNEVDCEKEVVR